MQRFLSGVKLALLGGDARETFLARHLADLDARVKVLGLPVQGENIVCCTCPEEAVDGIDALVLPVPGINEDKKLFSAYLEEPVFITPELLARLPGGCPVLVGVAKTPLKKMVEKLGLRLIEVMEMDEVAILNSIPSAEGAIQLAMENMPVTIHGSDAWVLGFGRTGMTLARVLRAMGARITVVARKVAQRARAGEMGLCTADFSVLNNISSHVDVIFNTVPFPVLQKDVLNRLSCDTLIVDIASPPGGTDFETARQLGIKAMLAPGLPGKVAPKTAGKILAKVVPRILAEELTLR